MEAQPVPGVRSDVLLTRPKRPPVAVEIVVTHDIESKTSARYVDVGVPVLVVEPTWDTLRSRERSFAPTRTLSTAFRCRACRRREVELDALQAHVDTVLTPLNQRRPSLAAPLPVRG